MYIAVWVWPPRGLVLQLRPTCCCCPKARFRGCLKWFRPSSTRVALSAMPDMSRATSPEAPPKDLWLSILDSVSSRRAVPEKQILILGEPSTGKTTIASAILQKRAESEGKDFLLGYDWCNVKDEADDGASRPYDDDFSHRQFEWPTDTILTRLSIYTAPSSEPTLTSLLPIFLPPKSALHHTAVVIVLDWSQPWTFIDHLRTWLAWIESWSKPDGTHELDVARDENREKCERAFT